MSDAVYLLYSGDCWYDEHEALLAVFDSLERAQHGAQLWLADRLAFRQTNGIEVRSITESRC